MPALRPRYRFTERGDGDLAARSVGVEGRRRQLLDRPWTWLHQVHGSRVVTVTRPGEHAGAEADAAVTAVPGAPLAVQVADCAPIALLAEGAVAAVHAGWRGLVAGLVPTAVDAVRSLGGRDVRAVLGPCIHAECYEFGDADLDTVADALGDGVRATTTAGRPALDLPLAVRAALRGTGVDDLVDVGRCTACAADRHWSHRARREAERQALVVWLDGEEMAS